MPNPAVFNASFTESQNFKALFTESQNFGAAFGEVTVIHGVDYYTGAYEFTPTQSTQTIPIYNKTAYANIIINPIPSNYGLITWDGSILTVS